MSTHLAETKIRANRNMTAFQVRLMSRLRGSSAELAKRLGWDPSRNNCFRGAPFEKGVLKDAAILAVHAYGPGRGIAAVSLPASGHFVFATIGLGDISSSAGRGRGAAELGLMAWDSEWYSAVFDDSVLVEESVWTDVLPYGVVFQIVVEELRIDPHSPNLLIDALMGGEAVEVGGGKTIHETAIPDVLSYFPEMIVYGHEEFRLTLDGGIDHAAVQRAMAQIALVAGSDAASVSKETRIALTSMLSQVGALVPFSGFTRAAFDVDPRSIFMALYRSLENLYSYSEVSLLVKTLGVEMSWIEAAEHLAEQLKWRPKEEEALRKILTLASPDAPIERLIASLPGDSTIGEETNLAKMAASRLYRVRNAVVHVRPGMVGVDAQIEDWDEVLQQLAECLLAADAAVEAGRTLDPSVGA